METTLLIVTIVSLALAIGMSVLGWRLIRGERERSAARVEALEALADAQDGPEALGLVSLEALRPRPEFDHREDSHHAQIHFDADDLLIRPSDSRLGAEGLGPDTEGPGPMAKGLGSDADGPRPDTEGSARATAPAMFAATARPERPRRRSLAFAIAAVLMAASAGTVYAIFRPGAPTVAHDPKPKEPMMTQAGTRPLELLSLRHSIDQSGAFTVTGLVQNPGDGQLQRSVVAVVFLFDREGNYVTTARAALDFSTLSPGDESPFIVRVPAAVSVGKYRVGFRYEAGGVVAHVDRRGRALEGTTAGG